MVDVNSPVIQAINRYVRDQKDAELGSAVLHNAFEQVVAHPVEEGANFELFYRAHVLEFKAIVHYQSHQ